MKRAFALVTTAALLLGSACSRDSVHPGQARLTFDGRVHTAVDGGDYEQAQAGRTLASGDKVKVLAGTAVLELSNGTIELRSGSEIEVRKVPTLLAGEALAISRSAPIDVRAADAVARVDGAARVERDLAVTLASYTGTARLSSTGRRLTVPALRQATSPAAGVLPARPIPFDVDEADAWDRRFLGVAIELDRQLESRSTGFTSQLLPTEGRTVGFFEQVLPPLADEPAFSPQLLETERAPGEILVGASIALVGTKGSFLSRWASSFSFREDGAAWGLVALDQAVQDVPSLTGTIDAAIGASPLRFASIARPIANAGGGGDSDGDGPSDSPSDPSPTPPTTQPGGGGGPGDDDDEEPVLDVPDTGTAVDPAVDPVEELIDELIADLSPPALP